MSYRIGETLP